MPKYLPTRTRSARPKFNHYPMLTRSTRFLREPRSRSSRFPYDRTRSLPDPYPIPFDLTRSLPDHFSSILDRYSSGPDRYPTLHTRNELQCVPSKRREDINPSVISRLVLEARVVIRGTSSKKSQRDFVPSTHPGTHELVLSTEKTVNKGMSRSILSIFISL